MTDDTRAAAEQSIRGLDDLERRESLEEWKNNITLYMHHDNMKLARIRHWLTTQTILFALTGILIATAFGNVAYGAACVLLLFATVVCFLGVYATRKHEVMDTRARQFTVFHRSYLKEIEDRFPWKLHTFTNVASDLDGTPNYDERGWKDGTMGYKTGWAGKQEKNLLRCILIAWVVLGVCLSILVLCLLLSSSVRDGLLFPCAMTRV